MKVIDQSCVYFVYPFSFDADRVSIEAPSVAQSPATERVSLWERMTSWPDGMLRVVEDFFRSVEGEPAQATMWQMRRSALESASIMAAGSEAEWSWVAGRRSVEFRLQDVRLTLFRSGVGLLILGVRMRSNQLNDWLEGIHWGRFLKAAKVVLAIRRRVGVESATGEPQFQPSFPPIANGPGDPMDGKRGMQDVVDAILNQWTLANSPIHAAEPSTARQPGETVRQARWWREMFVPGQMIPFTALFVENVAVDDQAEFLYRVQHFFRADQTVLPSAMSDEERKSTRSIYSAGQQFLFSMEGTSFVAFDPPDTPFFRENLPANLRGQYFFLFQMALFQRFALMRMSEQIAAAWRRDRATPIARQSELLQQVRESLLAFTAGGYFSQVVQRQRPHECYRKWQACFQIDELYERVRQCLSELQDHVTQQRETQIRSDFQRLDLRLRQVAFILGPPALCLSFVGIASWTNLRLAAGALSVGLVLGWLFWILANRPK